MIQLIFKTIFHSKCGFVFEFEFKFDFDVDFGLGFVNECTKYLVCGVNFSQFITIN